MGCLSVDGRPTEWGARVLLALKYGPGSPEEIAKDAQLPLFRVKAWLYELAEAGLASMSKDRYELTERGYRLISN